MTDQDATGGDDRFEEMTYDDCLARLAGEQIGRLAVVVGYYPQVFCVNYRLDGHVVVFRSHIGTKLLAAHHANVAFQVDHIDYDTQSGWSVVIQGMAEDVTDRQNDITAERGRRLGVEPWVPGDKPRIVRVIPAKITGRVLLARELDTAASDSALLVRPGAGARGHGIALASQTHMPPLAGNGTDDEISTTPRRFAARFLHS